MTEPVCSICFGTNVQSPGDICDGCSGIADFAREVEFPPDKEGHAAALTRIAELEAALRGMLEAMAMGTVEIAAKYGPDAHPDEPLVDAAQKARAVLAKGE